MPHTNLTALVITALLLNYLYDRDVFSVRILGPCGGSKKKNNHIVADNNAHQAQLKIQP